LRTTVYTFLWIHFIATNIRIFISSQILCESLKEEHTRPFWRCVSCLIAIACYARKGPIISGLNRLWISYARCSACKCVSVCMCVVCFVCVCPALTTRQCQGREGVAEIVARNYDAHTPNFLSLSEVRAPGYVAGSFPPTTSSSTSRVSPWSIPTASRALYHVSVCPRPSPPTHPTYRSDITRQNTRAWQRRSAPSNQKPIICLHVSLRRSVPILTAALSKIASRKLRDHRPTRN